MSKKLTILQARKLFDKVGFTPFNIGYGNITLNDVWHFRLFGLIENRNNKVSKNPLQFIKNPHDIKIENKP